MHTTVGVFRKTGDSPWKLIAENLPGIFALAFHPTESDTWYASTTLGTFRTHDAGITWESISTGIVNIFVHTLAIPISDKSDNPTIYAVGGLTSAYKSHDEGYTWTELQIPNVAPQDISAITASPQVPDTVYVGVTVYGGPKDSGGIYKSSDNGAAWSKLGELPGENTISDILLDPVNPSTLYVIANEGFYRSVDAGVTWEISDDRPVDFLETLVLKDSTRLVTIALRNVYYSPGFGEPWVQATDLPCYVIDEDTVVCAQAFGLEADPDDPNTLYAVVADPVEFGLNGIYRSTDAGSTWSIWKAAPPGLSTLGEESILRINPLNHNEFYLTNLAQIYKSEDRGETWLYEGRSRFPTYVSDMQIDPNTGEVYFAGNGVYRRENWYATYLPSVKH